MHNSPDTVHIWHAPNNTYYADTRTNRLWSNNLQGRKDQLFLQILTIRPQHALVQTTIRPQHALVQTTYWMFWDRRENVQTNYVQNL